MRIYILIAVLAILIGSSATVSAKPNGMPFREIWNAIEDLQQQINDGISLAWGDITGIPSDIADGDDIGTLSVNERSETFDCPSVSSCTYYVPCESDEVLTGGGFQVNDSGVGVLDIWKSAPDIGQNRWRVSTMNNDTTKSMNFTIYAMCGKIS